MYTCSDINLFCLKFLNDTSLFFNLRLQPCVLSKLFLRYLHLYRTWNCPLGGKVERVINTLGFCSSRAEPKQVFHNVRLGQLYQLALNRMFSASWPLCVLVTQHCNPRIVTNCSLSQDRHLMDSSLVKFFIRSLNSSLWQMIELLKDEKLLCSTDMEACSFSPCSSGLSCSSSSSLLSSSSSSSSLMKRGWAPSAAASLRRAGSRRSCGQELASPTKVQSALLIYLTFDQTAVEWTGVKLSQQVHTQSISVNIGVQRWISLCKR